MKRKQLVTRDRVRLQEHCHGRLSLGWWLVGTGAGSKRRSGRIPEIAPDTSHTPRDDREAIVTRDRNQTKEPNSVKQCQTGRTRPCCLGSQRF